MLICGGVQAELSLIARPLLFLLSSVSNLLSINFQDLRVAYETNKNRMCFSLPKLNVTQSVGASLRGAK